MPWLTTTDATFTGPWAVGVYSAGDVVAFTNFAAGPMAATVEYGLSNMQFFLRDSLGGLTAL